jgi:hypothetical protein
MGKIAITAGVVAASAIAGYYAYSVSLPPVDAAKL